MSTADENSRAAAMIHQAHKKDREDGSQQHMLAVLQSLPADRVDAALDLVWAITAVDVEHFTKDIDADAAEMAKGMAERAGSPAYLAAYIARIGQRHSSEVSLRIAHHLLGHAIDQLAERKAG